MRVLRVVAGTLSSYSYILSETNPTNPSPRIGIVPAEPRSPRSRARPDHSDPMPEKLSARPHGRAAVFFRYLGIRCGSHVDYVYCHGNRLPKIKRNKSLDDGAPSRRQQANARM